MEKLVSAPIIISPYWTEKFKVICDATGVSLGVVLRRRRDKTIHLIYYKAKTLNEAQKNYYLTEQELHAVVFE